MTYLEMAEVERALSDAYLRCCANRELEASMRRALKILRRELDSRGSCPAPLPGMYHHPAAALPASPPLPTG